MQQRSTSFDSRPTPAYRLSEATRIDISLRNFLCLSILETRWATAFHLGNIVRVAFVLAYLRRLGYTTLTTKEFRRAERGFSRATARFHRFASWELDDAELQSARQVVSAFDLSLECVPASVLAQAHRYAQANFNAPVQQRLSMTALVDDDYRLQPNSLDATAA